MTDCSNAEMRDLLPDLVHGRLDVADRARVEAHVASCAECASELALLRTALRATSSARVPAVDVAAIVGRLPAPPARSVAPTTGTVVSIDVARRARAARRPMHLTGWRQAAAVAAIVASGAVAVVLGRGHEPGAAPATPVVAERTTPEATTFPTGGAAGAEAPSAAAPTASTGTLALAGGVSDLSDDALVALIGDIDSLDRAPDVEPAAVLPDMTGESGE